MKYYLIRLRRPLTWAQVKWRGRFADLVPKVKRRFGDRLVAIEPAPVKPKPNRETHDANDW